MTGNTDRTDLHVNVVVNGDTSSFLLHTRIASIMTQDNVNVSISTASFGQVFWVGYPLPALLQI